MTKILLLTNILLFCIVASADSSSASLDLTFTVKPTCHIKETDVFTVSDTIPVTADDVSRGYVSTSISFDVTSNTNALYEMDFINNSADEFYGILLDVEGATPTSTQCSRSEQFAKCQTTIQGNATINIRLQLSTSATPGIYPWPLQAGIINCYVDP